MAASLSLLHLIYKPSSLSFFERTSADVAAVAHESLPRHVGTDVGWSSADIVTDVQASLRALLRSAYRSMSACRLNDGHPFVDISYILGMSLLLLRAHVGRCRRRCAGVAPRHVGTDVGWSPADIVTDVQESPRALLRGPHRPMSACSSNDGLFFY